MRPSVEAQRRGEVLDAARALIAERGLAQVRVADIAARAGTSTGTVHYYFGTKEDVLDAAFAHAVAGARERSLAALAGLDDPWERFVAVADAHLPADGTSREWPIWMQLWSEATVRAELRPLNAAHYGAWLDLLEEVVRAGQERGAFRPVDARDFAARLAAMMDGLAIQHAVGSREVDAARARELLLGYARAELLGPPAS